MPEGWREEGKDEDEGRGIEKTMHVCTPPVPFSCERRKKPEKGRMMIKPSLLACLASLPPSVSLLSIPELNDEMIKDGNDSRTTSVIHQSASHHLQSPSRHHPAEDHDYYSSSPAPAYHCHHYNIPRHQNQLPALCQSAYTRHLPSSR